nr:PAS domain-containing protein [Alloyangia mangrovi]
MTRSALDEDERGRSGFRQALPGLALAAAGLVCLALGAMIEGREGALAVEAAAGAFLAISGLLALQHLLGSRRLQGELAGLRQLVEADPAPALLEDHRGQMVLANRAAQQRFVLAAGQDLGDVLTEMGADAEALKLRLRRRAEGRGGAHEDILSSAGRHRLTLAEVRGFSYWRIERLPDFDVSGSGPAGAPADSASGAEGTAQVPVLTVGRSGAVLYMNAAARRMVGRRIKRLDEVLELPLRVGKVQQILSPEGARSVLIRCSDAGVGRQEVVLHPVDAAGAPMVRDGVDNLPVPLLRLAPDGRILRANCEACRMLEVDSADGTSIEAHMEGLGRSITDWLAEAAAGRGLHRSEFLRLVRPEREVFVQVTLNRVLEAGRAELIAVLNDATELKSLEAQFVQSQKMQAIGQLAGGVAHDFNNLLTAISGHCDLLLLRHDQGDADYADLLQINQNANRAAALVGQLLAFSRKQTLSVEKTRPARHAV